jgi:hypothetical protein
MKTTSKGERNNNLLAFFCFFALMWIVISTVFMRFVHYDSQYRFLDPKHYNVKVVTAEDHKQLSNPNYKSVNNDSQYVLVTLRGTAPFMHIWYGGITSTLTICIIGLFWGLRRKRVKEPQETEK